jgi:urease accessory protein
MGTDLAWLPLLLQANDSLFPTGAYAHSLGLEEMVRLNVVRDEATLGDFLTQQILPALAAAELPYLRFAHVAVRAGDVSALCEIDLEIDSWKICRELREASVAIGVRRLRMLRDSAEGDLVAAFERDRPCGHHLVVFALQMAAAPLEAVITAFGYGTLASQCGAAPKLMRIGQESCQRVLSRALLELPAAVRFSLHVARADAGWFNPMIEIASMRHESAWERLFIS